MCAQKGIKILKKLEIEKIKDLKIGIGIKKSNKTWLKIMLRIHLIIFVVYPEDTSTNLLSHTFYRDAYFDVMAPLDDGDGLKQILCCRAQS